MKDARLGEYLLWKDKPAKIVGEVHSSSVIIEMIEDEYCPHCQYKIGKHQFSVIPSSLLYQENAKPLPVINDDPTLTFID